MIKEDDYLKLDNQLCFVLYAASRTLTRLYGPFLAELSITYPQYLVMLVLWEHGTMTVGEIGRQLYLDSGTLTPLLKRLEVQGLVERKRHAADERKVMVTLTSQGQALKKRAVSVPRALFCRSGLSVEEFISIKQNVTHLLERMQADMGRVDGCAQPANPHDS